MGKTEWTGIHVSAGVEGNKGPLPGGCEDAVCLQGAEKEIVLFKNEGV